MDTRLNSLIEIKINTFPFSKYGLIDGEFITLSNDVRVEDTRRIIEFFLAPLLRYKQESIRER